MSNVWEWSVASSALRHGARVAFMRVVPYETTQSIETEVEELHDSQRGFGEQGKALSLNLSSGGMLLLMEGAPEVQQVLRVYMPPAGNSPSIPTLAEVRWVREVPFSQQEGLCFVGMRFLSRIT